MEGEKTERADSVLYCSSQCKPKHRNRDNIPVSVNYLYVPQQWNIFSINELAVHLKSKLILFKSSRKVFSGSLLERRKLYPFSSHLKQALSRSFIIFTSLLQEICIHVPGIKPVQEMKTLCLNILPWICLNFLVGFVLIAFNASQV